MNKDEIERVKHGLYRIYWSEDPEDLSVCAVGSNEKGLRWYAPTNWISGPSFDWEKIHHVELITTQAIERGKV
jgi:hypothetical protein